MSEHDTTTTTEGATKPGDPAAKPEATTDGELGAAGKAALDAERAARKAAEKRVRDLEAAEADRAEAKRKADEKAAAERGEWEKLAMERERERDEAKGEATSLRAENDQLRAAIAAVLADEWKALPAEVRDAYLGAEDDPLARLAFLPKAKKLAEKLAAREPAVRGNGPDPKAGGAGAMPSLEKTKEEMRRRMGIRAPA